MEDAKIWRLEGGSRERRFAVPMSIMKLKVCLEIANLAVEIITFILEAAGEFLRSDPFLFAHPTHPALLGINVP